jgi:hypothetical protein
MRYEASDEVFVAMPFTKSFQQSYETIIEPAITAVSINAKPLKARIINRGITGSPDIHEQIFDAIIHSRLVIADMTVQSHYTADDATDRWQANANVAYEVGLASAWRNPEDILLIYQARHGHNYSFDIQNLRHVSYDAKVKSSIKIISDEIARAINQASFLAQKTFQKAIQSISPSAIQYMHNESRRAFPVISFEKKEVTGLMDRIIHAISELLSLGALENRNVWSQGNGKGVAVIYQWTELGLRMLVAINAINQERKKELTAQIASVPKNTVPPQELRSFPKAVLVSGEPQIEVSPQAMS